MSYKFIAVLFVYVFEKRGYYIGINTNTEKLLILSKITIQVEFVLLLL